MKVREAGACVLLFPWKLVKLLPQYLGFGYQLRSLGRSFHHPFISIVGLVVSYILFRTLLVLLWCILLRIDTAFIPGITSLIDIFGVPISTAFVVAIKLSLNISLPSQWSFHRDDIGFWHCLRISWIEVTRLYLSLMAENPGLRTIYLSFIWGSLGILILRYSSPRFVPHFYCCPRVVGFLSIS